ncbi:hypothetical protein GGX14DRAFT_394491 [Mycena pura]|uniref:Uncharacterized protein n=1 Tax=Mycena pura TaxID=153505 RepID=A0AAD6VET8_9AGAR|nr:hypothetical protein GGX14DRAFT_394491 [Mycena pura]
MTFRVRGGSITKSFQYIVPFVKPKTKDIRRIDALLRRFWSRPARIGKISFDFGNNVIRVGGGDHRHAADEVGAELEIAATLPRNRARGLYFIDVEESEAGNAKTGPSPRVATSPQDLLHDVKQDAYTVSQTPVHGEYISVSRKRDRRLPILDRRVTAALSYHGVANDFCPFFVRKSPHSCAPITQNSDMESDDSDAAGRQPRSK